MSSVSGQVHAGFEPVREELARLSADDSDYGAQLCVYQGDRMIVDLWCGPDQEPNTVTGTYSVSKGVSATVIARLLGSGDLELDRRVADYWPEFAARGKGAITVRTLLSHQAGLAALDNGVWPDDALDSREGAARLAAQRPFWRPGTGFGYHGITIGILMEELVRRVAGADLQELYEREIRAPRAIDYFLGLPDGETYRYRDPRPPLAEASAAFCVEDDLAAAAFGRLLQSADATLPGFGAQSPAVRRKGTAAAGGVGSARGLARLYAAVLGRIGDPIAPPEVFAEMSQVHARGRDIVLDARLCFGVIFMKPHPQLRFGSFQAFGHDGAGGALGFADPLYDIGFGYIPSRMTTPGGADSRAVVLSAVVRRCLADGSIATPGGVRPTAISKNQSGSAG